MIDLSVEELAKLIKQAADAHHLYEQKELKGVRDEDWPTWYAQWILKQVGAKS